ncbi:MAG: hypothetical protein AB7L65_04920 [Hyphomonadaceae bacterium]
MGGLGRFGAAALALALAACGQTAPTAAPAAPPPTPRAAAPGAAPALWFLCDGVDAPAIFAVSQPDAQKQVIIREYDKRAAAQMREARYRVGDADPGAGNVYYPLTGENGTGYLRALNPDVLDDPSAAYTTPFIEIKLGERVVSCRWLERTRLEGFSTHRTFVVSEDADGDLIYRTYDFADAGRAAPVALGGAQRTSVFSREVRGGAEDTGPEGARFSFSDKGYFYEIRLPEGGGAVATVTHAGAMVQNEPLIAAQTPPRNE